MRISSTDDSNRRSEAACRRDKIAAAKIMESRSREREYESNGCGSRSRTRTDKRMNLMNTSYFVGGRKCWI